MNHLNSIRTREAGLFCWLIASCMWLTDILKFGEYSLNCKGSLIGGHNTFFLCITFLQYSVLEMSDFFIFVTFYTTCVDTKKNTLVSGHKILCNLIWKFNFQKFNWTRSISCFELNLSQGFITIVRDIGFFLWNTDIPSVGWVHGRMYSRFLKKIE